MTDSSATTNLPGWADQVGQRSVYRELVLLAWLLVPLILIGSIGISWPYADPNPATISHWGVTTYLLCAICATLACVFEALDRDQTRAIAIGAVALGLLMAMLVLHLTGVPDLVIDQIFGRSPEHPTGIHYA